MEEKNLTCICCPLGCQIRVEMEDGEIRSVTGNTCKNGDNYARKELTNPTRIVTSTVRVHGGEMPVVSVKTACDIPKEKIFACIRQLKNVELDAPVSIGQTVVEDIAGTGVAVIATRNVARI